MVLHQHLLVGELDFLLRGIGPRHESRLYATTVIQGPCTPPHATAVPEHIVVVPLLLLLLLLLLLPGVLATSILEEVLKVLVVRLAVLAVLVGAVGTVLHLHVSPSEPGDVLPLHSLSIPSIRPRRRVLLVPRIMLVPAVRTEGVEPLKGPEIALDELIQEIRECDGQRSREQKRLRGLRKKARRGGWDLAPSVVALLYVTPNPCEILSSGSCTTRRVRRRGRQRQSAPVSEVWS